MKKMKLRQYNFMNIEYDTDAIYDTDTEENDKEEIIIGFDEFEQEENDFSIIDYLEEEPATGFKIEETTKTFDDIINKKFTELNIQEEVDDMIIDCITELGWTYEESYSKLQEFYNLPLVEDSSSK